MIKKILSLLAVLMLSLSLMACSSSSYAPEELAAFNNIYKADKPASDGSNSVINITGVKINTEGNVLVDVGAPQAQEIAYAYNNFLFFDVLDASGKSLKVDGITMSEGDHNNYEVEFVLKGKDLSNAKYVKVGPYKTGKGNALIFELQK